MWNMSTLFANGFSCMVLLILNSSPNRNLISKAHSWSVNFLVIVCLMYYIHVKWQCKNITFMLSGNADFIKRRGSKNKNNKVFHWFATPVSFFQELQAHVDQITEMAAVMRKAIEIDEQHGCKEQERIFQLEQENKGLREILQITRESFLNLRKDDVSESTSLSALVTNSDLSLRKSWRASESVSCLQGSRRALGLAC